MKIKMKDVEIELQDGTEVIVEDNRVHIKPPTFGFIPTVWPIPDGTISYQHVVPQSIDDASVRFEN